MPNGIENVRPGAAGVVTAGGDLGADEVFEFHGLSRTHLFMQGIMLSRTKNTYRRIGRQAF